MKYSIRGISKPETQPAILREPTSAAAESGINLQEIFNERVAEASLKKWGASLFAIGLDDPLRALGVVMFQSDTQSGQALRPRPIVHSPQVDMYHVLGIQ